MALSTQYDPLFRRYQGRLPVAFLRALAQRESGMNPSSVMPGTPNAARGLLQVVGVVRQGYNEKHGTDYTPDDLLDPAVNVRLATDLLNRIVGYYQAYDAPNLKENWANPEFVKLVVAGWNAGYSKGGGVQKVVAYLQSKGVPVTHDAVFAHAGAAGAVKYLQDPKRRAWQRSVADLFQAQPDWRSGPTGAILPLLLVVGVSWGAYQLLR